jgi:hypothetical protein
MAELEHQENLTFTFYQTKWKQNERMENSRKPKQITGYMPSTGEVLRPLKRRYETGTGHMA